ncbi:MAG: hypothetical protein IT328_14605 [Caldilineaceae bacterium]|nr:hypothetical protein [Caldilineaceae bacterium]
MKLRRYFASSIVAFLLLIVFVGGVFAGTVTVDGITLSWPEYPLNGPALQSCEPGANPAANTISLTGVPEGATVTAVALYSNPTGGSPNVQPAVTYPNVTGGSLVIPVVYPADTSTWPSVNPSTNERAIAVSYQIQVNAGPTITKLISKSWWVLCVPPVPPTETPTATPTDTPTNTPVPPTATPTDTPTNTPVPPTATPTDTPTNTPVPPTTTPTDTPTNTPVPPTATPTNTPTNTPVPPTATPTNTPVQGPAQGCTPGYWRQDQHFDSWVATGYAPSNDFNTVFGVSATFNPHSLLDAVWLGGGGERALARHAVAALLNAAQPNVNYAYTTAEVIAGVQNAYATGNFEPFKNTLEAANQAGCPLN